MLEREQLDELIDSIGREIVEAENPASFIRDDRDFDPEEMILIHELSKIQARMSIRTLAFERKIQLLEKYQEVNRKLIYSMNERDEIDVDKMVLVALDAFIAHINEAIRKAKELGKPKLDIEKDLRHIQNCKLYLDGKNIEADIPDPIIGKTIRRVSSIDTCAIRVEGEDLGDPKLKALAKERTKRKAQYDQERRRRTKQRTETFQRINSALLVFICASVDPRIIMDVYDNLNDGYMTAEQIKRTNENRLELIEQILARDTAKIDVEKLILLCGYKNAKTIKDAEYEDSKDFRNRATIIKSGLEKLSIVLNGKSNYTDDKKKAIKVAIKQQDGEEPIEYSLFDLEEDAARILVSGIYASREIVANILEKLISGEIKFNEIDQELLEFIEIYLPEEEKIKLALSSNANLLYMIDNFHLPFSLVTSIIYSLESISREMLVALMDRNAISNEQITELFTLEKISAKDITGYISVEEIIDLYQKEKIDLYKLAELLEADNIDAENVGLLVLESEKEPELLHALDRQILSIQKLNELHDNGTMDNIGSEYIFKRYINEDSENNFTTLVPLFWGFQAGKLSIEQLDELYTKYGVVKEEDLYEAALKGYFSAYKIEQLYLRSLLSDMALDSLCENKIISEEIVEKIKSKLQLDVLKASYPFSGKIETVEIEDEILLLPDSKLQRSAGNGQGGTTIKGEGMDPEFKLSVLANLKVPVVKLSEECFAYDKDNPFYDYEFFVITDKDGEINENSIVIAEKLYKSREKREAWAYGDATYIFTLKDLKRIGKKSKAEIKEFMEGKVRKQDIKESLEEQQDVESYNAYQGIKRVIHRSKKSWAIKLAKTVSEMLGKMKTSIYSPERLEEIEKAPLSVLAELEQDEH